MIRALSASACRGTAVVICLCAILTACAPGGQSARDGRPGLALRGTPPASPAGAGAAVGQGGGGPEGTPGDGQALSLLGAASPARGGSAPGMPPPDAARAVEGVPVAILAPLSGRLSGPGQALLEGAQMAVFDVGNRAFRLLPLDTGGSAFGAERAAREAVRRGARLIVGPLLADSVAAVRPVAEAARIKVLAFSNSGRVAGGPVYLAGFTPGEQIAAIVAHAMAEGRHRFAVLAPSDEYGTVAADALREAVVDHGGKLVRVVFYDPSGLDFAAPIRRISGYAGRVRALKQRRAALKARGGQAAKRALKRLEVLDTLGDPPFDALLLPVLNPQTLRILSAQLAFYDVDQPAVRLLGLQSWDDFPGLATEPGLIGSRFPAARSDYRARFEARFVRLFGHDPSVLSALAYDVTALAAVLAGNGVRPPRYDAAVLTDPQGFVGAEGLFRFTEAGIAQRGFAIMEVRQAGVAMIQQAPARFERPPPVSNADLSPGAGGDAAGTPARPEAGPLS